jgi:lipoprotein-anchoring transpeptidase ErfK/SrfK
VNARLLLSAAAAVLAAVAIAAYAYDRARSDLIAEGVRVAGVDVGGMTADDAEAALRARLGSSLARPVVAEHRDRRFELRPRAAGVRVDTRAAVDAALARSREGNVFSRTARSLAGTEIDAEIAPRVTYSSTAVRRFVHRVERAVERPARDARVAFSGRGPRRVRARNGLAVRGGRLERALNREIASLDTNAAIAVPTEVMRPKVTTRQLAGRYVSVIVVDRDRFRLRLYRRLRRVETYAIGVGQVGYDTPKGLYRIQNKAVNPPWNVPDEPWAGSLRGRIIPPGPENPIKARWLGIHDGVGIHGTDAYDSIGTRASHGCIRMRIPEVMELYRRVPVGAYVYIA